MSKHLRQDVIRPRISFEDLAAIVVLVIVFLVAALIAQEMVTDFVESLQ